MIDVVKIAILCLQRCCQFEVLQNNSILNYVLLLLCYYINFKLTSRRNASKLYQRSQRFCNKGRNQRSQTRLYWYRDKVRHHRQNIFVAYWVNGPGHLSPSNTLHDSVLVLGSLLDQAIVITPSQAVRKTSGKDPTTSGIMFQMGSS